ncbi:gliding motility-associated C-terminal domain-containing protein [Kaistella sp.]|uniref:T9SS type B sorting domain-containing protein n=1 Tax=Kaistella sp. TaxID=2782235 RepID=UPI003C68A4CF
MKKFYFLVFTFLFAFGYGQSVQLYNPATNEIYRNEQYFCAGEKFNFKVDAVASSTGDYVITGESPGQFPMNAGAIPITFTASDTNKFSNQVDLGFTFSFYGIDYTKVVAGSNGRLVFTNDAKLNNLFDNTTYIDRIFNVAPNISQLPSKDYNKVFKSSVTQELDLAQIFFGYTNLVPKSQLSSVAYYSKTLTYNGQKGLLISFQNLTLTDYSSAFDSSVLLLEDGRIVIYVNNKNRDNYNAILGIQNESGTKAKVPVHIGGGDYNNGPWKSEGKAFLFTPIPQNLTRVFKWTNNGSPVGTNTDTLIDFTPNDNDVLKVEVTYIEDPTIIETDQVTFKKLQIPQISAPDYMTGCGNPAEIHVISPDPALVYDWYSDTDPAFHKTGTSIQVGTGSYYVQVKNTAGTCELKSASELVNISSILPPFVFENVTIPECDNLGLSSQTFNLQTITNYPSSLDYTIQYFEMGNTTPITSADVASGQVKNFTITVTTNAGVIPFCSFTKKFSISYLSFPPNDQVYTTNKLCFETSSYTIQDFKNSFFPTSSFQVLFSTDGVNYNSSVVNPKVSNPIWVKLTDPDFSCTSVVKLNFDFHPKVEIKPYTQFPEHCSSSSEYFDLNITKTQLEYSPDIKATFFTDVGFTNQILNLNYRGSGLVYIKVENTATGCLADSIPQLNLILYTKPALIKGTPETKYSQCGTTLFNLTTNINDYIGTWTRYSEIRYYDFAGNLLTRSEWGNYDLAIRKQPYMVFVYNETNNLQCSDRINFNLIEIKKPVAIKSQILICSEITYSLQNFKNEVINNSANYTFTDLSGDPLPANFDLSTLPFPVDFLMKDNATGCISDPQTLIFIQGVNSALLVTVTDYELCDTDFDGKTEFNLEDVKATFTNDPATFEYFKDSGYSQKINDFTNYTNENAFAETVYVRITISGFCPSSAEIHLKVNTPSKSSTLLDQYYICYGETLPIDAGSENTIFDWSNGETRQTAKFTKPGNYSVTLKKGINGCPYTHNFIISDENQPKIKVINQTNNSIEVIAEGGKKPYTYYFNDISNGLNNVLQNPTASSYKIQVESETGCFGPPKTVYFIKVNNAFTPNGDGKNDIWKIENLDKMEKVSIVIVDRNGTKVFESKNPNKTEWDGKNNGRPLPTSTYWYIISWYDAVTQKTEQRQGWILLKNRD